jgi:hypothetical protein
MRKRFVRLGIVAALLLAGALAYVIAGARLYGQYQLAYANFRTSCDALITWNPPTQILTGFYVNAPELVTIRYRSPAPEQLRLRVSIPGFTREEIVQVQAGTTFQERSFKPTILDNAVLDALVGPRQRAAQIHLQVQDDQRTLCDTSVPTTLLSRQWMRWRDPIDGDNIRYLAGWVTPQAPAIAELVGKATSRLEAHPESYAGLNRLYGYDQGRASPADVRAEVNALFDTLQSTYHVHYAEENVPYNTDAMQLIQLPEDILERSAPTAMCVETTAILASAVERLGMRPYVVIVPGHAFLGVALGAGATAEVAYWETSDLNGGVTGDQANDHGESEYSTLQGDGKVLSVLDVQFQRQQRIFPIE